MRFLTMTFAVLLFCFYSNFMNAQSIPSVEEVSSFFSNSNILITSREGGPIYGTFYFVEIHYCPQGYGLYGRSEKQTVLGNIQRNNWREFGTWKVVNQNDQVGLFYTVQSTGAQNFVPVYKLDNGNFFIGEGYTIVHQGQAICQ